MNCKNIEKTASLYVDGLLPEAETAQFDAHLDACVRCRVRVRELEALKATLSRLQPVGAPPHLKNLVYQRIEYENRQTLLKSLRSFINDMIFPLRLIEKRDVYIGLVALPIAAFFFGIFVHMYNYGVQLRRNSRSITYSAAAKAPPAPLANSKTSNSWIYWETRPVISSPHLVSFVQVAYPGASQEDSFVVMTYVTKDGQAQIEEIIEYPENNKALKEFDAMINTIPFKPATLNGKRVGSHLILAFSKINVFG